ncbi:syntaxin-4 [Culicoides brevitarsis]|uniref:syntaxin-4 n=1 Tax=Culicoides brevitarsis TaxID=469753 RepID=UPI00307BA35F
MVKDRLDELKRTCRSGNDVTLDIVVTKEQKDILVILDKFSEISSWIQEIKDNVELMRATISEAAFHYNDKGIRDKMKLRIDESLANCKKIHSAIKAMEKEIDENDLSTLSRIKKIQFLLIKDFYLRTYSEHEEFINAYEEKVKKIAQMEAKIMSVPITPEETEGLLANNSGNQCFVGNYVEETEKMRLELRDLMTRHNELIDLERSLTEVRDMFIKISTLVMEQGAMIQVVEYHAQQATLNVEYGADQLEKAREKKIKRLKTKSCILIWVTVILSLLIVILLFAP